MRWRARRSTQPLGRTANESAGPHTSLIPALGEMPLESIVVTTLRLLGAALILAASCVSPASSQNTSVEIHWIGLFGPYARNPPPDDPLPNVTLFPFGEIPRPLSRTNQVPAKLGSRFGFLFTPHGQKARSAKVRLVIYYPPPGLSRGADEPKVQTTDEQVPCMEELPCYVGYSFDRKDEILPGEWSMELFIDDAKVEKATFVVVEGFTPAFAAEPPERVTDKVVRFTAILESDPLGNEAPKMRQWLTAWVTKTSDFTVIVCDILGPISKKKRPYSDELLAQQIFGSAAYQIKNPGMKDESLIQLAGVESVLRAYEAIVVKDPKARIKYLDELLEKRRQGLLKDQLAPKITNVCARVNAP
jgi:hypothetical protein